MAILHIIVSFFSQKINCFFHVGPVMRQTDDGWEVVSCEPTSSIRFERLRDGIEEFEKINLLRSRTSESPEAAVVIDSMNVRLAAIFTVARSTRRTHAQDLQMARGIIAETLQELEALK